MLNIGEEEIEPEVDLSSFLERQRLSEESPGPSSAPPPPDEGEVDESLAHISARPRGPSHSKKGKIQTIDWDEDLDEMTREKAAAEATWGAFDAVSCSLLVFRLVFIARQISKVGSKLSLTNCAPNRPHKLDGHAIQVCRNCTKRYPQLTRHLEKVKEAPLLPTELAAQSAKDPKHEMQDFLDDLLG